MPASEMLIKGKEGVGGLNHLWWSKFSNVSLSHFKSGSLKILDRTRKEFFLAEEKPVIGDLSMGDTTMTLKYF